MIYLLKLKSRDTDKKLRFCDIKVYIRGYHEGEYHVGDYHVGDYHVGDYHVGGYHRLRSDQEDLRLRSVCILMSELIEVIGY